MENVFEEVVLQSVMKDIMMGQSETRSVHQHCYRSNSLTFYISITAQLASIHLFLLSVQP